MFAARVAQLARFGTAARSAGAAAAFASAAATVYHHSSADAAPSVGLDPAGWKKLTLTEITPISASSLVRTQTQLLCVCARVLCTHVDVLGPARGRLGNV